MLFGNHYSQSNPDPTALDATKRSKLVRARARLGVRLGVGAGLGLGLGWPVLTDGRVAEAPRPSSMPS